MSYKQVFQVQTTFNMNASPAQTYSIDSWLRQIFEQTARETALEGKESGKDVTVIIEVL